MNTNRKTAIIVGALFIIGTVGLALSVVLVGSILDDPDYLIEFSANENQNHNRSAPRVNFGICACYGSSYDVSNL